MYCSLNPKKSCLSYFWWTNNRTLVFLTLLNDSALREKNLYTYVMPLYKLYTTYLKSISREHLEITTCNVAQLPPHLQCIASFLPPLYRSVNVEQLIWRCSLDVTCLMYIMCPIKKLAFHLEWSTLGWFVKVRSIL